MNVWNQNPQWAQQQQPQQQPAQGGPPQQQWGPPPGAPQAPQWGPPQGAPQAPQWGPPQGAPQPPPGAQWGGPQGMPAPQWGPPQGGPPQQAPQGGGGYEDDALSNYTMGNAGSGNQRPYGAPGMYPRLLLQEVRSGKGGENNERFVAFDFKVLETPTQTEQQPPLALGAEFVVLAPLDGKMAKIGPVIIADVLSVAIGCPREMVQTPVIRQMAAKIWEGRTYNPSYLGAHGVEVAAYAYSHKARRSGNIVTRYQFKAVKRLVDVLAGAQSSPAQAR